MKTDHMINVLAQDSALHPVKTGMMAARAVVLSLLATGLAFMLFVGMRAGLLTDEAIRTAVSIKLLLTLSLAATALVLSLRLARPGAMRGMGLLIIAPALLGLVVVADIGVNGLAGWQVRLMGQSAWFCVLMVPLLSLLPLVAMLLALRHGAVTRPVTAGIVSGLAATGLGASLYALHCIDDSPLFVAAWYGLAAIIMMAMGAILGRLLLRW